MIRRPIARALAPLLLLAATAAAGETVPPRPPVQLPSLSLSAPGGITLSMSPDRPSEAPAGWKIRYEEILLEGHRLLYRLSPYPGIAKPVLLSAEFIGGPKGPADGRVLFDSSASKLPRVAFRGVMRPRRVVILRQDPDPVAGETDPDPAVPVEVQFKADVFDLGDLHGLLQTDKGERQHIAWADRAILRYAAPLDPKAAMGIGALRLTALYLYGRPAANGVEARPAVVLRMPKPVPDSEATVERQLAAHAYGMRASGQAITIFFDEAGKMSSLGGMDDFDILDGEGMPGGGGGGSRPKPAP